MKEEFNKFQEKNIDIANGYYKENKNIPEKFLIHSFLDIIDNVFLKYKSQIALYKRNLIAAASIHCECFHKQIKKNAKEKKVFEFTLKQL